MLCQRINERRLAPIEDGVVDVADADEDFQNRKIAYLLDVQTIRVQDLDMGVSIATINHDSKIDFLELNARADMLVSSQFCAPHHVFLYFAVAALLHRPSSNAAVS